MVARIALVAGLALLWQRDALACASCACGDPTLTTMGLEKPFAGRLRVSGELRAQRASSGREDEDQVRRTDAQLDLGAAWSARSWLTASATVPLIVREAELANDGVDRGVSVGDVELRAKAFIWRDRGFAPTNLLAVTAGLKLPTAPRLEKDGVALNDDAQPGTGSWDPLAGLAFSHFFGTTTLYTSATVTLPTAGWDGRRAGVALLGSAALQLQPWEAWGLIAGVDTRLEAAATLHDGDSERDTGGFIGYLSPRIVWSPTTDLLLHARVSVPVVKQLQGTQSEGVIVALGATLDL